jgi:hypothetical protein
MICQNRGHDATHTRGAVHRFMRESYISKSAIWLCNTLMDSVYIKNMQRTFTRMMDLYRKLDFPQNYIIIILNLLDKNTRDRRLLLKNATKIVCFYSFFTKNCKQGIDVSLISLKISSTLNKQH